MTGGRTWRTLGLMTGTSLDGVDACLADISLAGDGLAFDIIESVTVPLAGDIRQAIRAAQSGSPDDLAALHYRLGSLYADVGERIAAGQQVALAGIHGQTIAHADGQHTLQIGSPTALALRLGIPVVANFREADITAGGRGAPLMPFLDWLLCRGRAAGTLTLNIGGIANLAYVPAGADREQVTGFDSGPGMCLIDAAAEQLFGERGDLDGRFSSAGSVDQALLDELLAHPFIGQAPPKSTGTDVFSPALVTEIIDRRRLPPADLLRTLVRFTALSVAENVHKFVPAPAGPTELVVSGGGARHPLLKADLAAELRSWRWVTSEVLGVGPDAKEALLMAVLAVAKMEGIPGAMPGVTGAGRALLLGQVTDVSPRPGAE